MPAAPGTRRERALQDRDRQRRPRLERRPGLAGDAWTGEAHVGPSCAWGHECCSRTLSRLKIHAARRGPGPPLVAEPAGGATSGAA